MSCGEGVGKKRKVEKLESLFVVDDRKRVRGEEDEDEDEDDDDMLRFVEKRIKEFIIVEESKDFFV